MRSSPRSYKEENSGNQFVSALQGKLIKDGAMVELRVDKSSARAAVKVGPECGKLKNPH
jgi:hypothetical protein